MKIDKSVVEVLKPLRLTAAFCDCLDSWSVNSTNVLAKC